MKKTSLILLCSALLGFVLHFYASEPVVVDQILAWQPKNLYLAAGVLLICYAVKSTTVLFPMMILQIVVGHIYSRETAIFLNLLGLVIIMSVPYLIGRTLGAEKVERLIKKHPKVHDILQKQQENEMVVSFMTRACAVPLGDLVTMYFGASGMPFFTNVIGGVMGCFPSMMMTTLLGAAIRDPKTAAFWQALLLNIAWILLSGLGFWIYQRCGTGRDNGGVR